MFTFDFSDAAAGGYRFFWQNRKLIAQMAMVPLAIKIVCMIGIIEFNLRENFLRQGLLLLPAYFAEGWLVVRLVRIAVLGEGVMPEFSGNAKKDFNIIEAYSRTLVSATIVYVLAKMVSALIAAAVMQFQTLQEGGVIPQPTAATSGVQSMTSLFLAVGLLGGTIWVFRFFWLHVPMALGYSVKDFLHKIRPLKHSFPIVATWIVCFVPVMIFLLTVDSMIVKSFGGVESSAAMYASGFFQVIAELILAVIASVAMGLGFRYEYEGVSIR